tara:strand:+ start:737 stop:1174 length:438 start_codon:yes stop_codon:yes gene_type:complete
MNNNREFKKAISLVFRNGDKVLVLKRSPNKESFPNAWSIPSTYIHENETPSEAGGRLVKRKLNLGGVALSSQPLGISSIVDRGAYDFQMADFEVESYDGEIVFSPDEYTEMKWVTPHELKELIDIENGGEMGECTRTFLKSENII